MRDIAFITSKLVKQKQNTFQIFDPLFKHRYPAGRGASVTGGENFFGPVIREDRGKII